MTECIYFRTADYYGLRERRGKENKRVGVTAGRLGAGCTGPRAAAPGLNTEGGHLQDKYRAAPHVLISFEDLLMMIHLGIVLFYWMNWKLLCLH